MDPNPSLSAPAPEPEWITDDSTPPNGPWRSGKQVVAGEGASLGRNCVRCNTPCDDADYQTKRFGWVTPYLALLILGGIIGLLLYVVLAGVLRKYVTVGYAVCPRHRQLRRIHIGVSWAFGLAALGLIVAAVQFEMYELALLGIVVFIVGMFYALATTAIIVPKRVEYNRIWLGRTGFAYRETLPDYTTAPPYSFQDASPPPPPPPPPGHA